MKISVLIILLALACSLPMAAQSGTVWQHQFDLEAGYHMPKGDFRDAYDLQNGYGLAITYYYQLASRNSFISLSAGISQFKAGVLDRRGINANLMTIPVLLGYRYNFSLTGIQPYLGIETGLDIISLENKTPAVGGVNETALCAVPKAGLRIPLVPQLDFDVNIKYFVFFRDQTFSIIGLNAGIAYTIKPE